jgi:GntR family transcriptional repressor for pyruvate dehydrogenase complex
MAVTDEAILKIRDMIVSGELVPGQRLLPEKELSDRLGLSRSSMREAIKALELIRVLDVRRGDGTYVTSLEPSVLLEALSFVAEIYTDDSLLEVFAARSILESAAAGLAASRIDAGGIARLREMLERAATLSSVESLIEHDLEFHGFILEIAGNRYLKSLVDGLVPRTIRARMWRAVAETGAIEATLREHRDIVDALEHKNAALASALLVVHINVENWLRGSESHA